mgnify:CR=1 FL=1
MFKSLIILFSIFVNLLIYNRLYFISFRENIVFIKYFKYFLLFSLIELILLSYFNLFVFLHLDMNSIQSFSVCYFLMFLVIFFNICTKSYESPTFIIYNLIKVRKKKYSDIIKSLKKYKVIEIRIKDLIEQKLIIRQNNILSLTGSGKKFAIFYTFIKEYFKIKTEG